MANLKFKKEAGARSFTAEDVEAAEKSLTKYYSSSQLSTSQRCRRQYYFAYVARLKIPPNGNLIIGKSVHKGVEESLLVKQRTGKPLKKSDVRDIAVEEACRSIFEEPHQLDDGESQAAVLDDSAALSSIWADDVEPKKSPLDPQTARDILSNVPPPPFGRPNEPSSSVAQKGTGIEHGFSIQIPGIMKPVIGYIDLIEKAKGRKKRLVKLSDTKTSGKAKAEWELKSPQLVLYSIAMAAGKVEVEDIGLDVLIRPRPKTPRGQTQTDLRRTPATRSEMIHVAEGFREIQALDAAGSFAPNYGMQCTWCGYAKLCSTVGKVKAP